MPEVPPPDDKLPPPIDRGGEAGIYGPGRLGSRPQPARVSNGGVPVYGAPGGGKIQRISNETRGLFQDVTEWVELKMKLTQIEVEERVEAKVNGVLAKVIVGVVAAVGGLFALLTLALGLGALGIAVGMSAPLSYFLGFLVVTLLLLGAALFVRSARPDVVAMGDKKAEVDDRKLEAGPRPVPALNAPVSEDH